MSATAAICQFTTKPVRKLGTSSPPPLYQQISVDSRQISAATFICWDQGKFPHTRPSAGVPSNLCRIRANFCNRGHLPVCRQVSRFSWSRLFTCVLPRFFRVWADFHDRGYLPLCHQIRMEPEKISATSAVWADFRNRGLLYHQISMGPKQISAIAVIWLYITLTVLNFHRFLFQFQGDLGSKSKKIVLKILLSYDNVINLLSFPFAP